MSAQAEAAGSEGVVVEVHLREDQIERLDALAAKTCRRRSDLIRMAVDALGVDAFLAGRTGPFAEHGKVAGIEKAIS